MPLFVKTVYSVKEAQREMAQLVRTAESGRMATITRHDKTVAYVIGAEEMSALLETMEIMSDPKAMQAIRDAEAGVGRDQMIDLEDLPD
jgi:prevent-host-death family protein